MKSALTVCLLILLHVQAFTQSLTAFRDEKKRWGYKDGTGAVVIAAKYDKALDFIENFGIIIVDNKYGAVNARGVAVVPTKYDFIQYFRGGVAGARMKDKWGVIDTLGNEILPFQYNAVLIQDDGLVNAKVGKSEEWRKFTADGQPYRGKIKLEVITKKKGQLYHKYYGLKYEYGDYVVEPIYSQWDTLSANVLRVGIGENKYKAKYGLLDMTTLKVILPAEYDMPSDLLTDMRKQKREGGFRPIGKNEKYGFIDSTGTIVVPLKYDYVTSFFSGLALVKRNGLSGYIDMDGREVIPLIYTRAAAFYKGYALVGSGGKYGVINTLGEIAAPLEYDYIGTTLNGLMYFNRGGKYNSREMIEGGKWGFMEYNGKELLPARYDALGDETYSFASGTTSVKMDGVWRVIDRDGVIIKASLRPEKVIDKFGYSYPGGGLVIKAQFDAAYLFADGYALVGIEKKNGMHYGYIDTLGNRITELKYEQALSFSESLAAVSIGKKWGFINTKGREVTGFKYDYAAQMKNGLALFEIGKKRGYVDNTGKEVIPARYDEAHSFAEERALVKLGDKFAFLDPSGKEIIPLQSGNAGSFSHGLAWVKKEGKYGFIDKSGKVVIPLRYDWVDSFSEGLAVVQVGLDENDGKGNATYFYIDTNGNKAIDAEYARAHSFQGGRAWVFVSRDADGYANAETVIDQKGTYLRPVKPFVRALSCEEKTRLVPLQVGDVIGYSTSSLLYVITGYSCITDSYTVRTNGYNKGTDFDGHAGRFNVNFFKDAAYQKVHAVTCPVCSGKGRWVENKTTTKTDVDNYNAMAPGAKVITSTTYNFTETVTCGQCKGLGLVRQ